MSKNNLNIYRQKIIKSEYTRISNRTNEIYKEWSGMTIKEYKSLKGEGVASSFFLP